MNNILQIKNKINYILTYLFLFIMFSCVTTTFANARETLIYQTINKKKISINATNKSIVEILSDMQNQSQIEFGLTENSNPEKMGLFSINVKDVTIKNALDILFEKSDYFYKIIDDKIVIDKKISVQQPKQENLTVKGIVVDQKNKPIAGATILIKGTTIGAISSGDGKFILNNTKLNTEIEIAFIGYKTQIIKLTKDNIVIKMEEDVMIVEDVVVTGVIERKAESYTGSATTIKGDELKRVGNQNIFQSLKNIDPTIFIMDNLQMGSNPNALPEMNMRGGTSFPTGSVDGDLKGNYENKPNQPLFILDGFEASAERIFDLDMNLVESLTILKDAAAKALYGSKAANGVVVIETKKLNSSKPRFTYTGSLDLNMPDLSSYDLCNALEKLDVEFAEGIYPVTDKTSLDKYYNLRKKVLDGMDTYWLSKPIQFSYGQKHAINVELGKDELRTSFNVNYNDNVGVMKKSGRKNLSAMFNVQYVVGKLKFQNSMSITNNKSKDSPYGSFSEYTLLNPYYDMYDDFGQLAVQIGSSANPYRNGEINTKLTSDYIQFTNNFYAEWNIIDNLKFKARLGLDTKTNNSDTYYPASHSKFANYKYEDLGRKGSYNVTNGKNSNVTAEIFINYFKTVNEKHNFLVNIGGNLNETISKETIHYAEGLPSDNMDDIMFAVQYAKDKRPGGLAKTNRSAGLLGLFSYTYADKYLFDATVRTSGSSIFGNDKRWSTFWSIGIGWNLHKEKIMEDCTWLKQFKLRASVGTSGNQNFQNNTSIAINNYYVEDRYMGLIGSYLGNMENPQLKWEQKLDYNVGFDADLFGVNIKLDIYKAITQDLVTQKGIAPSTGFSKVSENLGKVENKGMEIIASYTPIQNENGFLRINGSIAINKDKIIQISEAMKKFNDAQALAASDSKADIPVPQYQDGLSMNTIWAVPSLGIDPAIGLEMYRKKDGSKTYMWKASDLANSGTDNPLYRGTLGLVGEYRGIGISITGRYLGGGQKYNNTLVQKIDNADIKYNFDRRVLTDRWSGLDQNAYFKRYKKAIPYDIRSGIYQPGYESNIPAAPDTKSTDRFVQDQNEFDISSISVYYDFNKRIISKIGLERLKISAFMNEVVKFSSIGIERGTTYPFARTVSIQLSATF